MIIYVVSVNNEILIAFESEEASFGFLDERIKTLTERNIEITQQAIDEIELMNF